MIGKAVEIYENIFHVGGCRQNDELNTNSYLMIDGDDGILFGPGSVLDFESVFENITSIIPVEKLKYAVLHSQDPLFCASLPLFEAKGFSGKIVTHRNTSVFVKHYGITSPFIYTNLTANRLTLKSGRVINFINTPYLKSAGSFVAYDNISGILFSGDLFGALRKKRDLYAGEDYFADMKKYHAEYMPDNNILNYCLDIIMKKNISMIAPQYGSIIRDNLHQGITALMEIQCGTLFRNMKIDTPEKDTFTDICNNFLKQYYNLFPKEDVLDVFKDSGIRIDEKTGFISGCDFNISKLWHNFFDIIVSKKGFSWITVIEEDLKKTVHMNQMDYPEIYGSFLSDLREKYKKIEKERTSLVETLNVIEKEFQITGIKALKDPLAQVYKEDMFSENLVSDIEAYNSFGIDFAFFILEIDNLNVLNNRYGREAGDEILANTAYVLKNFKKASRFYAHHLIFRMNGPRFTYYCNDITREEIISIAEAVRTEFRESRLFVTNITVSIGVVHSSEFSGTDKNTQETAAAIVELAGSRLRLAKHKGSDSVCSDSETGSCYENEDYIMVIDPDTSMSYMIETHLKSAGFNVVTCSMGDEALKIIDTSIPQLIISEIILPKIDGFSLRKKIIEESALKDIPFIITSAIKDEKSIIRAQSLGVYHYFKKPYSIVELIGLVKILSDDES